MVMTQPLRWLGAGLARYLSRDRPGLETVATSRPDLLVHALQPGDVLLVEGTSRLSGAIKYLTQSTWSHAALFVGDAIDGDSLSSERRTLIEADVNEGVRAVSVGLYADYHTRICRPVGLTPEDRARVIEYMTRRIGDQYDLRNIIDLARYLITTPPVPQRWRRRMLALGSGDPTRAICSSLIAQAFQSVRYPILPDIDVRAADDDACPGCIEEIHHIRHHTLFAPRDFDVSPFFEIVKPRLLDGFDYRTLTWSSTTVKGRGQVAG